MKWVEVAIVTTKSASEAVASILIEAGATGVSFEGPGLASEITPSWDEIIDFGPPSPGEDMYQVKAYYPEVSVNDSLYRIHAGLQSLEEAGLDIGCGEIRRRVLDEADWASAWKAFYHPHRVGERLVICPTWEDYRPEPGECVVRLDPGMAFGTGDHPTTILCLRGLERHVVSGMRVLDLGTGSGILAIAAALLGARVDAMDIDSVAVEVARKNALDNGVEDLVSVSEGTLEDYVGKVDLFVANIVADVIKAISPIVPAYLSDNGIFLASGIVKTRLDEVRKSLREAGLRIAAVHELDGWVLIEAAVQE